MRFSLTLLLCALACTCVRAQRAEFPVSNWNEIDPTSLTGDRRITPATALTISVDGQALQDFLSGAPHERKTSAERSATVLDLPLPNGNTASYKIVAYDISEQGGLDKYPNIRTYYGINVDDPRQSIFLDWTDRGFHASIRGGGSETVFIDPLFRGDTDKYQAYRKSDFGESRESEFECLTSHEHLPGLDDVYSEPDLQNKLVGDCELRQYRFTMSATGAYSAYHGANSASQSSLVQSAVVTTVNRVNQVYTREISVRFQLVANNNLLYGYGGGAAPFSANSATTIWTENTPLVNTRIGQANYDYGHAITQGQNNGIGQFEAPCSVDMRAQGCSSHETPEADIFDIDYVSHEMGHNFNGRHTQNNSCNRDGTGSVEPGSGSSIMGYAGICSPDVQEASDDYFHGRNIEQMTTFAELNGGATCGAIINSSLSNPTVSAQTDETIPAGTPFVLTTSATGNGTLNYNWEQNDAEFAEEMPPVGTNTQGPLFRGFNPDADPERFFPVLSATVAGVDPDWEELPQVSRTMDFRATIFNFNAAYGCVGSDDIVLTVDDSDRPFIVTDPADGNRWSEGQIAQVQWDVAETDQAPYSSQSMDILLSTDGGETFQTLVTGTPNDGYEEVTVPNGLSTQARIMVRSADNVFFNVSPEDFTIGSSAPAPAISARTLSPENFSDCFLLRSSATFEFLTTSDGGAEAPITWSVAGLPGTVTPNYSVNPVRPGGSFVLTVEDADDLPLGITNFTLTGTSTDGMITLPLSIERTQGDGGAGPTLVGPIGGLVDTRPILRATSQNGTTFQVQISTTADFSTLVYNVSDLPEPRYSPPSYLAANTSYFWRIREGSECGTSAWSGSTFTTLDCEVTRTSDNQRFITSISGPYQAVQSITYSADRGGTVADVDAFRVSVNSSDGDVSNLRVQLESPSGDSITLFDGSCSPRNNFDLSFDDEASSVAIDCSRDGRTNGLFYRPRNALSTLDGTDITGTWRLTVIDDTNTGTAGNTNSSGILNTFSLKVCREALLPVSFLSFSAVGQEKNIQLNWETTEEEDNYGFYIERQPGNLAVSANWTELGFVPAGAEHAFTDATALAHTDYLYRLRQTDLDGRVSYSPIEAARFGSLETGSVVLFPNPTSGEVNYRVAGTREKLFYHLFDVTGKLLREGSLLAGGGTIDLSTEVAGVYLLRVGERTLRVVRL